MGPSGPLSISMFCHPFQSVSSRLLYVSAAFSVSPEVGENDFESGSNHLRPAEKESFNIHVAAKAKAQLKSEGEVLGLAYQLISRTVA